MAYFQEQGAVALMRHRAHIQGCSPAVADPRALGGGQRHDCGRAGQEDLVVRGEEEWRSTR